MAKTRVKPGAPIKELLDTDTTIPIIGVAYIKAGWSYFGLKKHYYFRLVGQNGELVGTGETYTQKHNVKEVLEEYFPNFEIVDKS